MKILSQPVDDAACLYTDNTALSTQGISHPSQETAQDPRPVDDEKGAITTNANMLCNYSQFFIALS